MQRITSVLSELHPKTGLKHFIVYDENFEVNYVTDGYTNAELVKINGESFIVRSIFGYDYYRFYRDAWRKLDGKLFMTEEEIEYAEKLWEQTQYKEADALFDDNRVTTVEETLKPIEETTKSVEDFKKDIIENQDQLYKTVDTISKECDKRLEDLKNYYENKITEITNNSNNNNSNNNSFDKVSTQEINRLRKLISRKDYEIEILKSSLAGKDLNFKNDKGINNPIEYKYLIMLIISNLITLIMLFIF